MKRKERYLTVINHFTTSLLSKSTLDDIVWDITKSAISKLGFVDCVVYLLDDDKQFLIPKAAHGPKNPREFEVVNPIKIPVGKGIVGTVAVTGVCEIINDTSKDPRYIIDDEFRLSEISVPVIADGEVIGVIDSEHPQKYFFSDEYKEILTTVASIASTKITQAIAKENLKKHQANLEHLVKQRTIELRQQTKKLETAALMATQNPYPIFELNAKGKLLFYNPAMFQEFPEVIANNQFSGNTKDELILDIKRLRSSEGNELEGLLEHKQKIFQKKVFYIAEEEKFRYFLTDITKQKFHERLIDQKNKDITDSIEYAKRIQQKILPKKDVFKGQFHDAFVMFKPKDIVSGDFYWLKQKGYKTLIAVADCTGHGVPGAMMGVIGYNTLDEVVAKAEIINSGLILDEVDEILLHSLGQVGTSYINDGMNISFLAIDQTNNSLEFSGAYQSILILRDGEITQYDGDKKSLGVTHEGYHYTTNKIEIQRGDQIYLFSDGYIHQFGGKNNKKLSIFRFKEILLKNEQLNMNQQEESMQVIFELWKNREDQIDDVCVVGIKI